MDDMARARDGRLFHQGADEHYDQISALIKSVRGSDPDAGLYWMARMIEAGEDPRFLARRMVILASEDIGLADPQALLVAEAAARAVEYVGLPEAALNLAEAVIYLARAPKSNAVVVALGRAQADVRSSVSQEVPTHLRDAHYKGAATLGHGDGYVYPHDDPSGVVPQQYRPDALEGRVYYEPTPRDAERCWRGRPEQGGRFVNRVQRESPAGWPPLSGPCCCSVGWRRPPGAAAAGRRRAGAGAALPGQIVLPQAAPHVPAGSTQFGAPPAGQVLDLDVVLAGQDPAGLAQAVAAVSTPGSPDYRHYLTAAQYAAEYGPSAAEVAQVSSALRSEGLTVGTPEPGSTLLPVSGTASVVSAALGTPLESVQAPGESARAIVNTASPQVPGLPRRRGDRGGRPRRPGQGALHAQAGPRGGDRGGAGELAERRPSRTESHRRRRPARPPAHRPRRHPPGLRRRPGHGLRRHLHLDPARPPSSASTSSSGRGAPGSGSPSPSWSSSSTPPATSPPSKRVTGCPTPSATCPSTAARADRPRAPGEAALDTELAAVNAPSASLVVYEAPNGDDAQAFDLFNQIASDDSSQVVTTSWGVCEAEHARSPTGRRRTGSSSAWRCRGRR